MVSNKSGLYPDYAIWEVEDSLKQVIEGKLTLCTEFRDVLKQR